MDRDDDGILWEVVEEHLDEAEFLWSTWERGLTAPRLTAAELGSGVEARLQAHIHGLVVAAPAVIERVLAPALHDYQRDRAAAAAWAWLAVAGAGAVGPLCEHLASADPPECRGIARALGLFEGEVVEQIEPLLLHSEASAVQAAALMVFAAHRRSPGPVLAELAAQWFGPGVSDPAATPRRVALVPHGVPEALRAGLAGELGDAAFDEALWVGLRRGFAAAREVVWRSPTRRSAALALGACGGERGLQALLVELGADPAAALWGLGFAGRRAAADACVGWIEHAELGPLAAESLAAIAGLDFVGEQMTVREAPEDPDDEDVPEAGPDDGIARPDPERVRGWWQANRARFDPQQRYIHGALVDGSSVAAAFERAPMRRRPGLAFEVAMRTRGQLDVDVRSFTWRQRDQMSRWGALKVDWTACFLD